MTLAPSQLLLQIPLVNPVERLHRGDVDPLVLGMEVADERAGHDDRDAVAADEARVAAAVLADQFDGTYRDLLGRREIERIDRDAPRLRADERLAFHPAGESPDRRQHLL